MTLTLTPAPAPGQVTFSRAYEDDPESPLAKVVAEEWPGLTGKQTPWAWQWLDGDAELYGVPTTTLYERVAGRPMPWQTSAIRLIHSVDDVGRWTHKAAALVCPRQNGKSEIIIALVLYRMFVLGHKVLYTSLEWDSAKDIWHRVNEIVQGTSSLDDRVIHRTCSQGKGTFTVEGGGSLVCRTRSAKAGRGLTKIDLLIVDEALDYTTGDVAALGPIQKAADDPQVVYATSAVNLEVHANGELISGIRAAVLDGRDTHSLYMEWCAPEDADPEDPLSWSSGNPAYGYLSTEEKISAELRGLPTEESRRSFAVETLGHGQWFRAAGDYEVDPYIPQDDWEAMIEHEPIRVGQSVMVVDADPERSAFAVAAGVICPDDKVHVTLGLYGQLGSQELADWIVDAYNSEAPTALVIDPRGPAGVLIPLIEDRGVEVMKLRPYEAKGLPDTLVHGAEQRLVTRDDDPALDAAWHVATVAKAGTPESTWLRRPGTCQLIAASIAAWGVRHFSPPEIEDEEPEPGPTQLPRSSSLNRSTRTHRARAMSF